MYKKILKEKYRNSIVFIPNTCLTKKILVFFNTFTGITGTIENNVRFITNYIWHRHHIFISHTALTFSLILSYSYSKYYSRILKYCALHKNYLMTKTSVDYFLTLCGNELDENATLKFMSCVQKSRPKYNIDRVHKRLRLYVAKYNL